MAWDPTKPQSTDYQRNFPAQAQGNWEAIEDCIGVEHQNFDDEDTMGIHKFPVVTEEPTGMEGRIAIVDDVLWHYSNAGWHRSGDVFFPDLLDSNIIFSDITTNNASALKHGFLPKLSNVSTQYLNGLGQWANAEAVVLQLFTSNGTWTKPSGAKLVHVFVYGGGGGGAGGAGSGYPGGGGGGGGGHCYERILDASEVGSTVSCVIGAGGNGGGAASAGSNGSASNFGGLTGYGGTGGTYTYYSGAGYGSGGAGGQNGYIVSPEHNGGNGGASSTLEGTNPHGMGTFYGAGGGGAGAYYNAAGTLLVGAGNGGVTGYQGIAGPSATPTGGYASYAGGGGGGGSGFGGWGAAGGIPGGGGGGAANGGAGGAGARGAILVITYR